MKSKIKIFALLFIYNFIVIYAQPNLTNIMSTTFNYTKISENNYNFNFISNFNFGDGNCDYLFTGSEISIVDDVLDVKGIYNITGFHATFFCASSNTITYNQTIPLNVNFIKMSSNVITYNDLPPYGLITVKNVYIRVFDLNSLSNHQNSFENSRIKVFPNPTTNLINIDLENIQDNCSINLKNILDQTILTKKIFNVDKTNLEINEPNGVYLIEVINDKLEKQVFKIVKN